MLLRQKPKHLHGLTESDLDGNDKMDVKSALKICSPRVLDLLDKPEQKGLKVVLQLMQMTYDAFYNKLLTPLERIGLVSS